MASLKPLLFSIFLITLSSICLSAYLLSVPLHLPEFQLRPSSSSNSFMLQCFRALLEPALVPCAISHGSSKVMPEGAVGSRTLFWCIICLSSLPHYTAVYRQTLFRSHSFSTTQHSPTQSNFCSILLPSTSLGPSVSHL